MFMKLPVVNDVDCKSRTPVVVAPAPRVVTVLLVKDITGTVLEVVVKVKVPSVGVVSVPIPTLPAK